MINILTKVLALFNSQPDINKMGFLSTFFKVTPESFTDSEFANLDEIYEGEDIAPVVTDLSTGAVTLVEEKFVNRQIPFPVFSLKSPAQIAALMNRQPGESAFVTQKVNWLARLAGILVKKFTKMTKMIKRTMEYEAAQVLQTGDIILTDENGEPAFRLGLIPETSHFPIVTIPWGTEGADPLGDIEATINVIRDDGLVDIEMAIFDSKSWGNFIRDEWVQKNIVKDGLGMGALSPGLLNKGAQYMGWIYAGTYKIHLWTYNATYNPFKSLLKKRYIEDNKVILLPAPENLDFRRLFGGIPTVKADATFDQIFGADKVEISGEYDFRPRVFWSEDNESYIAEIKSRPLMLPVSANRYGCITTQDER